MNATSRVLVVDDDPGAIDIIQQILASGGYAVESAQDGGMALARIDDNTDLVLLDVMMPDLNGLQVCRRIRAQERIAHIPIIMVTALAGEAQRHAGFAAGADDYISKPFTAYELLDRVHVWTRARERFLRTEQGAAAAVPPGEDSSGAPGAPASGQPPGAHARALEEQVLQVEGLLHYLVAEARTRPGFLASLLMPYAQAQGWDEDDFAIQLGCPRATLTRLLLRPRPLALTWTADVASIAEACGANAATLGMVLCTAEAWERRAARPAAPASSTE
jgi:DNA-binding response OmpR family regulator